MFDVMEHLGRSLIQHGKSNDRIYLMKLHPGDLETIPGQLDALASRQGYSKIFCKVPAWGMPRFEEAGYLREASIPRFYSGREDVFFMSRFLREDRRDLDQTHETLVKRNLDLAMEKQTSALSPKEPVPGEEQVRELGDEDIAALTALYKTVFPSYPFPIHQPAYIAETMQSHIRYFGMYRKGRLVAASSAETDPDSANVEMTDFATLPETRGRGMATTLLSRMDREMSKNGFITAYTIARAHSAGMNLTFAKRGYRFGGTLVNNTQISGCIESMNVWYRHLD